MSSITNQPAITTIVLTFNHAESIEGAVRSVLAQEYPGTHQVLVADDRSDDGTTDTVARLAREDRRVLHLLPERRLGMVANFAHALRHVTTPLIALLEGDDLWCDPSKLLRVATELRRVPALSACGHMTRIVGPAGPTGETLPRTVLAEPALFDDCLLGPPCHTSSIVWHRSAFPAVPDWMIGLPLYDYPQALLLSITGPIAVLPEVMSEYRLHQSATWSTRRAADRKARASEVAMAVSRQLDVPYRRKLRRASAQHALSAAGYLRRDEGLARALVYLAKESIRNPMVPLERLRR